LSSYVREQMSDTFSAALVSPDRHTLDVSSADTVAVVKRHYWPSWHVI